MGIFKSSAIFLLFFTSAVYSCPPREELGSYCRCNDLSMICGRKPFFRDDELQSFIGAMNVIAKHRIRLSSLSLMFSSVSTVPSNIFNGTHIEKIFFSKSPVLSFSESDIAFQGLEESLSSFSARDATFPSQWNWNQLRRLHSLKLISVNKATLESIEGEFPHLPKLQVVALQNTGIKFLGHFAFKNLPQMFRLWLTDNKISELKRTMFPNPASSLKDIMINNNNLHYLPEDIFTNMPALRSVALDGNKLTTLPEETFKVIFDKLSELTLAGNPIKCDCRLKWITERKFPAYFNGRCASPTDLKDTPLKKLDEILLHC